MAFAPTNDQKQKIERLMEAGFSSGLATAAVAAESAGYDTAESEIANVVKALHQGGRTKVEIEKQRTELRKQLEELEKIPQPSMRELQIRVSLKRQIANLGK